MQSAVTRTQRGLRKVRRSLRDGTFRHKASRRLANSVTVPLTVFAAARRGRDLWIGDLDAGAADHRGTALERTCSPEGIRRISDAYVAAVRDAPRQLPPQLEVRGVWAEWLHLHYGPLRSSLMSADVPALRALFENIHREPMSTGVGGTYDDFDRHPAYIRRAYFRATWTDYRCLLEQVRPDWRDVRSSVAGNPVGPMLGGRLVQIETLRHAHHATVLFDEDRDRPIRDIVEIGGGLGGQATQFLQLANPPLRSYTIVDLPEVAALASFMLMATFGEECLQLYGEDDRPDLANPTIRVLPPAAITAIPECSADLVFNSYSFAEMDSATSSFYLDEVHRICRSDFFHVNHETRFRYTQEDGTESVNLIGSELVPDAPFSLVWRRPRGFSRPENRGNVGFAYLYRRDSRADSFAD